jgi:RNA polymerase sigma-70 factor (ECF subfamily)
MSDEALLAACAVGESAALGALFDRHNQPVFRFVSRISCGPASDVEDLVQCTFIEVWRSAAKFRRSGSGRSWIFGIAANLTRTYVRSEVRRRKAMDGLEQRPDAAVQTGTAPDEKAAQREMIEELGRAVGELRYDERVAFVLCDLEEMPGVEAARVLGVRKGTLWRRLHDARKKLRVQLEKGGQA